MDKFPSHIGIDFDNTIADYDHLFVEEGVRAGWYPSGQSGSKQSVRDHVRALWEDGERNWQILQARVYAHRMPDARVMSGFGNVLRICADRDILVSSGSHKTRFAKRDGSRTDRRDAALRGRGDQGSGNSGTRLREICLFPEAIVFFPLPPSSRLVLRPERDDAAALRTIPRSEQIVSTAAWPRPSRSVRPRTPSARLRLRSIPGDLESARGSCNEDRRSRPGCPFGSTH